jgi:hypothetical protein
LVGDAGGEAPRCREHAHLMGLRGTPLEPGRSLGQAFCLRVAGGPHGAVLIGSGSRSLDRSRVVPARTVAVPVMIAVGPRGVCRTPSCDDKAEAEKPEQLEGPFSRTCQNITSSLCLNAFGLCRLFWVPVACPATVRQNLRSVSDPRAICQLRPVFSIPLIPVGRPITWMKRAASSVPDTAHQAPTACLTGGSRPDKLWH